MERIADSFWAQVEKTDGCWNWRGLLMNTGYGLVKHAGNDVLCHRYVWWAYHGQWPEVVMHLCDNRCCVRPDHLRGATQRENIADAVSKRRHKHGAMDPGARLSDDTIRQIRKRYAIDGLLQKQIAAEFGVAQSTISRALARRTWKHV